MPKSRELSPVHDTLKLPTLSDQPAPLHIPHTRLSADKKHSRSPSPPHHTPKHKTHSNIHIKPNRNMIVYTALTMTNAPTTPTWYTTPEFIYGGPFKMGPPTENFLDIAGPFNTQLQGNFMQSYAYYSLRERTPVVLTKVIDYVARSPASDTEVVRKIAQLKSDLLTNKRYKHFEANTEDARKWNDWIENTNSPYYFTNSWLFTECYVYRKMYEAFQMSSKLNGYDPFAADKKQAFADNITNMCVVAKEALAMMSPSEKAKRKLDFTTLMKLSLWANKNDLSHSGGERITVSRADPMKLIVRYKDKMVIDDSNKAADTIFNKAEAMKKKMANNKVLKPKCSCDRLSKPPPPKGKKGKKGKKEKPPPAPAGEDAGPPPDPVACPAKTVIPSTLYYDIVCDNAGFELFMDLCIALFILSQGGAQKIRFHLKKIPWFVSDATPDDLKYVIDQCASTRFDQNVVFEPEPKPVPKPKKAKKGKPAPPPPPPEPEPDPDPVQVTSNELNEIGRQLQEHMAQGNFMILTDDYWVSPHGYKDMKRYSPHLYRTLQLTAGIMFKGDMNYRKLMNDTKWPPYNTFESCLQGFTPAPMVAIRTVKSDVIGGMPKAKKKKPGMYETATAQNAKWMETGDYGVIQFLAKCEPVKVWDRPCVDWPDPCKGIICPEHPEL